VSRLRMTQLADWPAPGAKDRAGGASPHLPLGQPESTRADQPPADENTQLMRALPRCTYVRAAQPGSSRKRGRRGRALHLMRVTGLRRCRQRSRTAAVGQIMLKGAGQGAERRFPVRHLPQGS
jgi:hypothetical protein